MREGEVHHHFILFLKIMLSTLHLPFQQRKNLIRVRGTVKISYLGANWE